MSTALVFGGTGALGAAIVAGLGAADWTVDVAGRQAHADVSVDLSQPDWARRLGRRYDAVIWAQGANVTAGITDASAEQMHELYEANVVFITETLAALVAADALAAPARGVVVSSVWQTTARADKLAYVASKAALSGLIPAIAADLAGRFAINAVLPGVIDTPMTRANLSAAQLEHVQAETLGGALATADDVANAVAWLADRRAAGINAQWIVVDNGWSAVRSV